MTGEGYISLHRQIWNNFVWDDKPFSMGQAWIDLLMLVNHEDKYVVQHKMTVKRGQRILSQRYLAERWGWSRTKISDFLNSLQSADMLKFKSDTKKTVITIANYDFYQKTKQQKSHRKATEKPPKSTNNNDNNDNKEYIVPDSSKDEPDKKKVKKTFTHESDPYKAAKYMTDKIAKHTPNFPHIHESKIEDTRQRWADDIDKLLRIDNVNFDEFKKVLLFSQADPFWQKNILSGEKLRKQYGRLLVEISEKSDE